MVTFGDAASTQTCSKQTDLVPPPPSFLPGSWVITCGNYNGDGGTIVHLLLPPLGTRAGGMDVHSSDLYDWGQ